jgi:hypothetical protein
MARPTRYIPSHTSLGHHPKLLKFARKLNISRPQAVGHLNYFWWWAMTYAEDGNVMGHDVDDIAIAAEWEGDAEQFTEALLHCGFLDADMTIHNWERYGGKLLISTQNNAERQSRYRDRHQPNKDVTVISRLPLNKNREEEKREEKPTVSIARKTKLRPDWFPNADEINYAITKGLADWEEEAESFRLYWGGNGNLMQDWSLTWKRWVRTALQKHTSSNGRRSTRESEAPTFKNADGTYR